MRTLGLALFGLLLILAVAACAPAPTPTTGPLMGPLGTCVPGLSFAECLDRQHELAVSTRTENTRVAGPPLTAQPALSTTVVAGATGSLTTTRSTTPASGTPPAKATTATKANYAAAFVRDVSVEDGTVLGPGEAFTKKWALRNTGAAWGAEVKLRFVGGTNLAAATEFAVPATAPGQEAELAVPMTAPQAAGKHQSKWRLCRAEGCFGPTVAALIVVK